MDNLDMLNYRPDLKWDEREVTAFEERPEETTQLEDESGRIPKNEIVTSTIEEYEAFKEDFKERVEDLERELDELELDITPDIERALEETGHVSRFSALDFRELFTKKESSPGKYLLQVLEKRIQEEDGSLDWEIYIEYLELIEEIEVLDYYIQTILYPLFGFDQESLDALERLEELEKNWLEDRMRVLTQYQEEMVSYRESLYKDPDRIPVHRDNMHQIDKERMVYRQGGNQMYSALIVVQNKMRLIERALEDIDNIQAIDFNKEEMVAEFTRATENQEEMTEVLKQNALMLKQTIDMWNEKKDDLKETRRNLYSKDRQKRIIEEYGTVNTLYRENVLPSVHYMKSYQDNRSEQLDTAFNASAQSLWENHLENREKAYETFLLQISTSQIRNERLNCVREKHKSRILFNDLYAVYKELS